MIGTRLPAALVVFFVLAALSACGGASPAGAHERGSTTVQTRFQMGTLVRVAVAAPDDPTTRAAMQNAFDAIDRVVAVMSEWEPDSDVSRINRAAGGEPVRVDPALVRVLAIAETISDASDGAFDVSWAPLGGVWCFDPGCGVPAPERVEAAIAVVDHTAIELDREASTVRLRRAGMRLGLGSIAKGHAIARAAEALRAAGFESFVIDAGGDVYAAGDERGTPWTVAIADPRGPGAIDVVQVRDAVVVTSGDYERFVEVGGERYHHILDVRSGQPARGVVQVSVVATDPTVADGLATAAFVLGPERGLALLERWDGVEGLLVGPESAFWSTSGWPGLLE